MREHNKLYLKGLCLFVLGAIGFIIHIKRDWEFFPVEVIVVIVGYILIIRSYQWGHRK